MRNRLHEALLRRLSPLISIEKTGERRIPGAHRAAHLHGFMLCMPGTFGGHENRAGPAKGCQHIGNAVIHQGSCGTCGQLGARLQLFPILGAGQLCQLLRIRLNQRRLYLPRNGSDQRRLRGIDGDLAFISAGAQLRTQLGIIRCLQSARQRTGEYHPICVF